MLKENRLDMLLKGELNPMSALSLIDDMVSGKRALNVFWWDIVEDQLGLPSYFSQECPNLRLNLMKLAGLYVEQKPVKQIEWV